MTIEITGSMAGHADRHTESSLAESFENAYFTAPWDIYPKSRSKPSRYSSENDVLIEKSVKYTDFFLLSIVYV